MLGIVTFVLFLYFVFGLGFFISGLIDDNETYSVKYIQYNKNNNISVFKLWKMLLKDVFLWIVLLYRTIRKDLKEEL